MLVGPASRAGPTLRQCHRVRVSGSIVPAVTNRTCPNFRLSGRRLVYWQQNRAIVRHSAHLADLLEALQGLRDDLIGVEVAVLGEPAAEEHAAMLRLLLREGAVALVELLAGDRRHGV